MLDASSKSLPRPLQRRQFPGQARPGSCVSSWRPDRPDESLDVAPASTGWRPPRRPGARHRHLWPATAGPAWAVALRPGWRWPRWAPVLQVIGSDTAGAASPPLPSSLCGADHDDPSTFEEGLEVLVTGGAGYVGSFIVRHLLAAGTGAWSTTASIRGTPGLSPAPSWSWATLPTGPGSTDSWRAGASPR